jgi:hypothetical protein
MTVIPIEQARIDFEMKKGDTFNKTVTIKNDGVAAVFDGYTARMQIRPTQSSETVIHELTTDTDGGITLGENGVITLTISAEDTAAIEEMKAVYDLELVTGETVSSPIGGEITFIPEVTRESSGS